MMLSKHHLPHLAWLSILLLLGACAHRQPLPDQTPQLSLPMQLHVERHEKDATDDWLLVIQQEGSGLRWSLFNPLGVPLARQLLLDGRWQADGLLPPNAEARALFAALLFALSPAEQLDEIYVGRPWSVRQNSRSMADDVSAWHVHYMDNGSFELDVGPRLTYRVAPIVPAGARPE
ncbi:hypothetical protein [Stutzerimonas zhaodongensis]|uniref:hypothetical protein n=1 Tax=Stutzerimonas TaxID=2901164 RepID=UPI00388D416F